MSYREFLRILWRSAIVALIIYFIFLLLRNAGSSHSTINQDSQIYYYADFLFVDDPPPLDDKQSDSEKEFHSFVFFLRDVSQNEHPLHRIDFLKNLTDDYRSEVKTFQEKTGNNPELMYTLLFDKSKIIDLILREEKERDRRIASLRPAPSLVYVFFFFQVISIGWLILWWATVGSWNVFRFPYRAWWFYVYLAFMLPCSLALIASVACGELVFFVIHMIEAKRDRFRTGLKKLAVRLKIVREYDDLCANINKNRAKHKDAWISSFGSKRISVKITQENVVLEELGRNLRAREKELQTMQRDYFAKREFIKRLKKIPNMTERLAEEFDELSRNPLVKALEVKDDCLVVYTDAIFGSRGTVGPFRIDISPTESTKRVSFAAKWSRKHPTGDGTDGPYCFGNANELIDKLLEEYRIAEGVGLMLKAFQSN
ncbi:MAG: hypothetical protein KGJ89_02135 [Patescibacteria group bacterium]|nr:hypothetical protein [Patescibacteria group bacterium]MDE2015676.1 hypothetical protein [Patescibacteria group bacterium]MDE2226733.1 hypothetical protein [Patescibacteria group bacterium]